MRYIGIKQLPATLRANHLNFKPLLAKLRRDKWLELNLADFKKLTGSRAKSIVTVPVIKGLEQKFVGRVRRVGGERLLFLRAY